jgi:hypothetical protein
MSIIQMENRYRWASVACEQVTWDNKAEGVFELWIKMGDVEPDHDISM